MSIFVPLKEAPWAKFGAGTKTVEVRNAYGRLFTACQRCAKDVNVGKEPWERR